MSAEQGAKKFLERVEKYIVKFSDPKLIKQILSELNLDKMITDNKEFNEFILKISTQKIDLSTLIKHVELAIVNNKPLCSLLAFIQENELISDIELERAAKTLQLQINLLCVFEAITITMVNGDGFAEEVYTHLTKRSGSRFPGNPIADFFLGTPYHASLFERLKFISIKPGMLNILFHKAMGVGAETKADVDAFVQTKNLSGWNADIELAIPDTVYTTTAPSMGLNIFEAMWEDSTGHNKNKGGMENAAAGGGLIGVMEECQYTNQFKVVSHILPEAVVWNETDEYMLLPELKLEKSAKKISQFNIHSQWRDLYSSWNLFFVISNIDTVFLPIKLLLPTVFSAEPPNYKEVRVISLFLFGSILLAEDTRSNPFFSGEYNFKNAAIILKNWGKINKDYANELLLNFCPTSEKEAGSVYQHMFGNYPHLNFMWNLLSFSYNSQQYSFSKAYSSQKNGQSTSHFFAPANDKKKGKEEVVESVSMGSNLN
ncbi:symporter [Legionella cardiaca]|uniref:Symporter n=1 Tax=Legionella cardiaca TaxID=1071983 RepID=A0ABY8AUS7_9GAMM|nr:symporter [Legionella cardiaca]WED42912.1 symporter [Legionella cardiaca]